MGVRTDVQEKIPGQSPSFTDPSRSFGYGHRTDKYMQTAAARALNEIFRVHLFRVAIAFHIDMSALGYEWGDTPHCDGHNCHPAPDMLVKHAVTSRMSVNAGSAGSHNDIHSIGHMWKLVYSLED